MLICTAILMKKNVLVKEEQVYIRRWFSVSLFLWFVSYAERITLLTCPQAKSY